MKHVHLVFGCPQEKFNCLMLTENVTFSLILPHISDAQMHSLDLLLIILDTMSLTGIFS